MGTTKSPISFCLVFGFLLSSTAPGFAQQQYGLQRYGQQQYGQQNGRGSYSPPSYPQRKPGPAPQDALYKAKRLDKEPELPGFPKYSGKTKLIKAFQFPSNDGIDTWNVRYYVQDEPSTVRDWYYGAFRSQGWELPPANNTNDCITAMDRKNGLQVQVTTYKNAPLPYHSTMYVRYIRYPEKKK